MTIYQMIASGESDLGHNQRIYSKNVFMNPEIDEEYKKDFIEKCCDKKQFMSLERDAIEISVVELNLID